MLTTVAKHLREMRNQYLRLEWELWLLIKGLMPEVA